MVLAVASSENGVLWPGAQRLSLLLHLLTAPRVNPLRRVGVH